MPSVPARHLASWLTRFDDEHSVVRTEYGDRTVSFIGAAHVVAVIPVPFEPLAVADLPGLASAPLLNHLAVPRTIGVLLVRRGGYAAGIFDSGDHLVASKVGTRLVHARHKKGGSSQARFARRHANEVRDLVADAVEVAASVLGPVAFDVLLTGGDRGLVRQVLADHRLHEAAQQAALPWLPLPDPRLAVLRDAPKTYRSLQIQTIYPDLQK